MGNVIIFFAGASGLAYSMYNKEKPINTLISVASVAFMAYSMSVIIHKEEKGVESINK